MFFIKTCCLGVELWIVSYKWLLDSLRIGELLSEYDYWVDAIAPKPRHVDEHVVDNAEQSTCVQAERFVYGGC